jgi:NADH-quinone oxidoreductase subunit L
VVGAVAIAGVPGLAGFFSKDEILYKAFAGGHTLLWVVGLLTSLMTAVYMFRLVFLTFHGERRGGDHGHLHDAPPAMAVALIALAIGSALAGYVGLPHALGGSNRLETFLEPSFAVTSSRAAGATAAAVASGEGQAGTAGEGTERMLMVLSSAIALGGIGIAWYFFLANRASADSVAASASGLRTLLLNKYYIDEIYDAAVVQPIRLASEEGLWKRVDVQLIDGAVNGAGAAVCGLSGGLRRLQTGSVRTYAASLLLGAVLVIGFYLWP